MKEIYFMLLTTGAIACASPPTLTITSSAPARIEKNGITVCEETPCTIKGSRYNDGFGNCVQAVTTNLEAFPIDKSSGYTQSKQVVGHCGEQDNVFFDMSSRVGVATSTEVPKAK